MNFDLDPATVWLIAAAAVATFVTRIGGYLLIQRVPTIPPRAEAALNAVPAAVLTTLFAPAFFTGGLDIKLAMLVALAVSLRYPGIAMLFAGWLTALLCRRVLGL